MAWLRGGALLSCFLWWHLDAQAQALEWTCSLADGHMELRCAPQPPLTAEQIAALFATGSDTMNGVLYPVDPGQDWVLRFRDPVEDLARLAILADSLLCRKRVDCGAAILHDGITYRGRCSAETPSC